MLTRCTYTARTCVSAALRAAPARLRLCSTAAGAASSEHVHADVIVVGAGVPGLTLACQLASEPGFAGRSIAVVDAVEPPKATPEELRNAQDIDLRVFAIAQATTDALTNVGAWDAVEEARSASYSSMQVWDTIGSAHVRFEASEVKVPALGRIVENRVLQSALYRRLLEFTGPEGNVKLFVPGRVSGLDTPKAESQGPATLHLEDGTSITSPLVVGADGANSRVRALCNVGSWGWDYDQRALVSAVETTEPNTTAWQRFLPTGPLALLPLWGNYSSIVWSGPPELAAELQGLDDADFVARLNDAFAAPSSGAGADAPPFLKPIHDIASSVTKSLAGAGGAFRAAPSVIGVKGPRASFPLRFGQANSYWSTRVAFVGDSAHTVHPLAGQGMNLGVGDASTLGSLLVKRSEAGQDLGAEAMLADYGRRRKAHSVSLMLSLDVVKGAFACGPGVFADARNVGMGLLNALPFVKSHMAQIAMGTWSPVSKLPSSPAGARPRA